jgi:hypothetical protein
MVRRQMMLQRDALLHPNNVWEFEIYQRIDDRIADLVWKQSEDSRLSMIFVALGTDEERALDEAQLLAHNGEHGGPSTSMPRLAIGSCGSSSRRWSRCTRSRPGLDSGRDVAEMGRVDRCLGRHAIREVRLRGSAAGLDPRLRDTAPGHHQEICQ